MSFVKPSNFAYARPVIAVPTNENTSRFFNPASCSIPASESFPLLVKRKVLRFVSFAIEGIQSSLNFVEITFRDSSAVMWPRCSKNAAS